MSAIKKFIFAEKTETFDNERSVVGWGSKPIVDRDKELIKSDAWDVENYRKNPVLMLCHDYKKPPVGKCLWVKPDGNGLKFKAQFAKTAAGEEMYQLYKDGIMNGFSVGFAAKEGGYEDNPTDPRYKGVKRVYTNVELFEISCVPIPALPEALAEYVKSGKLQTKELNENLGEIVDEYYEIDLENKSSEKTEEKSEENSDETTIIVTKPEVTENTVRIPVDSGKHDDHKIRTISISQKEGIQALYCVDDKVIMTYIFDKDKWDMERAKKWVDEHKKSIDDMISVQDGDSEDFQIKMEEHEEQLVKQEDEKSEDNDIVVCDSCGEKVKPDDEGKCPKCGKPVSNINEEGCKKPPKVKEEDNIIERLEQLEEAVKSLIVKPKTDDNISCYNLFNIVYGALLTDADKKNLDYPVLIDISPMNYPNGYCIYCVNEEYFKTSYSYNVEMKEVTFSDDSSKIESSWINEIYGKDMISERQLSNKEGRVLSGKNRSLITQSVSALQALLDATDTNTKPIEADKEIDSKDVDEIEIDDPVEEDKEIEIDENDLEDVDKIEVDEKSLREAVALALKNAMLPNIDIKTAVTETIAKMKGKVTLK